MLAMQQYPESNILEFTLDGGMTHEEFDQVAAKIEEMLQTHQKIRLVEVIKEVGGIEPSALWADMKFGPKHLKDFSHVAVVADQKWIEWAGKMARPLVSAEVRTFGLHEIEDARRWIRQG
ncbi:MAG: STAS/SEC14 domain-containing protein [Desulfobacterales bacterium]